MGKRVWRRLIAAAALCVVAATAVVVLVVRHTGLFADRPPGAVETFVAGRLVRLSIPAAEASARSPFAGDPLAWRAASPMFRGHCAACHAADGRGRSAIGPHLYPPVPDLADPAVQGLSDGALFAVIRHGVRWTGMPAFRSALNDDDTWRLVAYVRQVPHLTAKDLAPSPVAAGVSMVGTRFAPADLTVAPGDTVTWRNTDPFPHNVTATGGAFRSGDLDPDGRWQLHAPGPGVYPYTCTLHPGMKGVLRVQ